MRAPSLLVRELSLDELGRVGEIDVSEDGDLVFVQRGTELVERPQTWHRPRRSVAEWTRFVATWRTFVPANGVALGAFEGGGLVGIATLRRGIRPALDQLEALFVDAGHRRQGIAVALVSSIVARAQAGGARALYVSATPSRSAVGFYLSIGFRPTDAPIPELLALEPEDVHMLLQL